MKRKTALISALILTLGLAIQCTPAQESVAADVAAVHAKLPETKILLLGIFPRSMSPNDNARVKIKQVNDVLSKLDGKDNVKYLDIGEKFLESDGTLPKSIMPDALHPNAKGYVIWAEAIRPTLEELAK